MRVSIARSAASNAAFFAVGAAVFIAFSIFYTRHYGVERYGEFSFLLNTATALIALGAYEGFLITHSVTQTRAAFDRFNARYVFFNAGLVVLAAFAFAAATGIVTWHILAAVVIAILLDYLSQSSIAVLITRDDNWKIRAFRTAYQVTLVAVFVALQAAGVALALSFAVAVLTAAVLNFALLRQAAVAGFADAVAGDAGRPDAGARVLLIAVATNLATVGFLLLDKLVISWFDVGHAYEVGLYFLFFDLAVRAEAIYLLLAVPVTNHLFTKAQGGVLASREITWMVLACICFGAVAGALGHLVVPPIYDVSLWGFEALPWMFGLYVAARGIRYVVKAVCNATGLHWTLLASNCLVLGVGGAVLATLLLVDGRMLTVVSLAAIIAAVQLFRLPFLIRIVVSGAGVGERLAPGRA